MGGGVRVYQCMHLAVMIIHYRIFVYWFTRAYAQSSGYDLTVSTSTVVGIYSSVLYTTHCPLLPCYID